MDKQAAEKVFHNDYIMTDIIRMLDLKQQFELQKICPRMRFLVIFVWRQSCKDVQMNRNDMGRLTDDEYFQLLLLNSINLQKLTILEEDGAAIQMYFPAFYPNLLEVHIKGFELDENILLIIARSCPHLQFFEYEGSYNIGHGERLSLEILQTLTNLRTVLLTDLYRTLCYEDVYLLATKVRLERLELWNVHFGDSEWDVKSCTLDMSCLRILKLYGHSDSNENLSFIKNCPNLQELYLFDEDIIDNGFFDNFKHLETLKLEHCTLLSMPHIIRDTKLKCLEVISLDDSFFGGGVNHVFSISEEDRGLGGSLRIIKAFGNRHDTFWPYILKSTLTNFENLRELSLATQELDDDCIRSISLKCHLLKVLHLDYCGISGRYINHLVNVEQFTVRNNTKAMTWSNLYVILRDLKLLRHLEIDSGKLIEGDLPIQLHAQQLAISLEILKISREEDANGFLNWVLNNSCEGSFNNTHTLYCETCPIHATYKNLSFLTKFKHLHTLQLQIQDYTFEESLVYSEMIPTLKHLVFKCNDLEWPHLVFKCYDLEWPKIFNVLKCTNLETFEISTCRIMTFYCGNCSLLSKFDANILKDLRNITLPYVVLEKTKLFWQRCLAECPPLQFCCTGHIKHADVLNTLFEKSPAMNRVSAIHANRDLYSIKKYCARNMNSSKIPVYLLDANSKRRFEGGIDDLVIVIEADKF